MGVARLATDRKLFMQNYVKALKTIVRRLFNHFTGGMDFEVHEISTSQKEIGVKVTNWECSCAEYLRKGAPCSHLLARALTTPEK